MLCVSARFVALLGLRRPEHTPALQAAVASLISVRVPVGQ